MTTEPMTTEPMTVRPTVPQSTPRPILPALRVSALGPGLDRLLAFVTRLHAPYQAALVRIGISGVFATFLVREWPHRRVLYGDRSPWSVSMARTLLRHDHGLTLLAWTDNRWWFEGVYAGALAAALLVMVGWHSRLTSVLFMIGVLSLENRNGLVGDGGDNVIRIMVIYLIFTRCGEAWSLDARRIRRHGPGVRHHRRAVGTWIGLGMLNLWAFGVMSGWAAVFWLMWLIHGLWYAANRRRPHHQLTRLMDACTSMLHNSAMLVIAAQVCLIYSTAGWYKIQGTRWEQGSAIYYALHLDYFTPWPGLSGLLSTHALLMLVLSYGTVMVQVAFPFTLANRKVKNVLLAVMLCEHAGIAVILGIPFLSLAMMVCDCVFLPTAVLMNVEALATRGARWVGLRSGRCFGHGATVPDMLGRSIPETRSEPEPHPLTSNQGAPPS